MAFSRTTTDRPESLLFRAPQSPHHDPAFINYASPISPMRSLASRVTSTLQNPSEVRGSLQRRFTTNALPTLAPIGEQRKQAMQQQGDGAQPTEKKAREYEALLAQQRRIQAQMELIDPETRREVDEVKRLEHDISQFTSGVLSEPATPPDYHRSTNGPAAQYSNRFSGSLLTLPSFANRPSAQVTSPAVEYQRPFTSHPTNQMPSRSVPGSQRNSDHEGSDDDYAYAFNDGRHKAGANPNRNSMPVTSLDLRNQSNYAGLLGALDTTSYLLNDNEYENRNPARPVQKVTVSPDSNTFLQLHQTNDRFPILLRRETDSAMQSNAPTNELSSPETQSVTDRATAARHRQSLPPSAMRSSVYLDNFSGLNGLLSDTTTAKNTAANRRSLEVKFSGLGEQKRPSLLSAARGSLNGFGKTTSSYSTNDIPTLKSIHAFSPIENSVALYTPADELTSPMLPTIDPLNPNTNTAAAMPPAYKGFRYASQPKDSEQNQQQAGAQSGLKANAPSFGPVASPSQAQAPAVAAQTPSYNGAGPAPYNGNNNAYYGGYGMQLLNNSMNNMALGGNSGPYPAQAPTYNNGGIYSQHAPQSNGPRRSEYINPRAAQPRRTQANEENLRFAQVQLESLVGEIYGLCKDQYGCRFLQKKLEERKPSNIELIFDETEPHVVELMTDPFGNYLCQKLLEYANDEQRTALIKSASPQMIKIALNQHGTRALQKMIEFISSPVQVEMITTALDGDVVSLIQDLNGNHVIQKCLNHLEHEDVQFIVDAVCTHVVIVGTHRHGCCVLQRCIDHASGAQRAQIVRAITEHCHALVQDPFGNYVVQYIMDIGEPKLSEPLCQTFLGHVAPLSRQKFSSNVVEKGIRTASEETRRALIMELTDTNQLEKMMHDGFANYVIQTALDYADPETKGLLIDVMRPIVPSIRHTPHGRRIAQRIQEYDGSSGTSSGQMTPQETSPPPRFSNYRQPVFGMASGPGPGYGMGGNRMNGGYNSGGMNTNMHRAHPTFNPTAGQYNSFSNPSVARGPQNGHRLGSRQGMDKF
ncbi:hypothetical protein MBLNU457_7076t2 [Dothideomycetes sp. NU457]